MSSESKKPRSLFYASEFKRALGRLGKKYRKIKSDIEPLLQELSGGALLGDKVPGTTFDVFKVRVKNSSSGRGKSGGFRVIYEIGQGGGVTPITIYSKTEKEDVTAKEIRTIIERML